MSARSAWVALFACVLAGCGPADARDAAMIAGGEPARGERAIRLYGCGTCHDIPGITGAKGTVGPPLAGFAARSYIGGVLPNEPEHLVNWIMAPQDIDPKTAMPNLGVTAQDARDIAAYLYTLTDGGLGPPHPVPSSVLPVH